MRRIARSLGAGTMSLYRYIATRDDLLALMGDALLRDTLVACDLPADWRAALGAIARQTREAYLSHPWAVAFLGDAAALRAALTGPNGLRRVEQSLAALAWTPMDDEAKLDVLAIVDSYVFGHLLRAVQAGPDDSGAAESESGAADFLATQLQAGELPQLAAIAASPAFAIVRQPEHLQARFELGLTLLLDGIAARFH